MAECGVTGQESYFWQCMLFPAGTPTEIVDKVYKEIARVVTRPDVKERLAQIGFEPVASPPAEFAKQLKAEIARWGKVIQDVGIKRIE